MSAWIEPGTASLCLYCSLLLLRGKPGMRVLSRHLRHGRETVMGVALDEFSDLLCDRPDALLTIILCSLLAGPRCRLGRAPTLLRCVRCRVKAARRVQLLHILRRPDPAAVCLDLQQAQAKPDEHRAVCLHPLPANALRPPALFRCQGRGQGAALHLLRQLAATGVWGGQTKDRGCQKASVAHGSGCPLHDAARGCPISRPAVRAEAGDVAEDSWD